MPEFPKLQRMEEAIQKGINYSSSRKPDMGVKAVPTMEAPRDGTWAMTESLGGMTVMKEPQMIMIQMIMMTMITVAMMTPPVVMDTHFQAAATPNIPIQIFDQDPNYPLFIISH